MTMNSDNLTEAEQYDDGLASDMIEPGLTDTYNNGGLFGFRFE